MAYIGKTQRKIGGNNFQSEYFSGDGATTSYPMGFTAVSNASILVTIDGVKQHTTAYNISSNGDDLIFVEAPPTTSAIEVLYFGVESIVTPIPPSNSIGINELSISPALLTQAQTFIGKQNIVVDSGSGNSLELTGGPLLTDSTVTSTNFIGPGTGLTDLTLSNFSDHLSLEVVDPALLNRGQLLEEIAADSGQDRIIISLDESEDTTVKVTTGVEGQVGVAGNATNVPVTSSGLQYFFTFPTAQYNEGNHAIPQPNLVGFTNSYGSNPVKHATIKSGFDPNGNKLGLQEMGTGVKLTWSIVPDNVLLSNWESLANTEKTVDFADTSNGVGFDPTVDIRDCFEQLNTISGLSFYEIDYTDSRRTDANDTDLAHINIYCCDFSVVNSTALAHAFFPGYSDSSDNHLTYRKRKGWGSDEGPNTADLDPTGSEIAFNSAVDFFEGNQNPSGNTTAYSFKTVFKHELCHALGLAHTNDTETIMFPSATVAVDEKPLSIGELQGLQTIYGLPKSGTSSSVFRSKITDENGSSIVGRDVKDVVTIQRDFVRIGTAYDDTQLLVKGKVGINTSFPTSELDVGGKISTVELSTVKLSTVEPIKETVYTIVQAGSGPTYISPLNGGVQTLTVAAAGAIEFADMVDGQSIILMVTGASTYSLSWSVTWVTPVGNVLPTLTDSSTLVIWKVGSTLYGAFVGSYV
jgi:hypothetical protein